MMSKHGSYEGDGTLDSPMVVLSDESHSSPQQRDNDNETPQGSDIQQDGGANDQVTVATGEQSAVAHSLPIHSMAVGLPAPPASNNTPAIAASTLHDPATTGAPTGNGAVVAGSVAAAANQNNAPAAGVPSGATVMGSVPAIAPPPGTVSVSTFAGNVPAGVNQALRHQGETFTPHPTDPTKIIARFRVEIPHQPGHFYEQVDTIPILDDSVDPPNDPPYYFIPNLTRSKVEKRIRASKKNGGQPNLWVRQGTSDTWIRNDPKGGPDQVFKLQVMFRRFNKITHKYEDIYSNLGMLRTADPNTKKWMYAYNKWIDQIRRRRDDDYEQKVKKDHWSVAERRALCIAINAYVRKAGLHRFGSSQEVKIPQADMQVMADAVNNEGGMNRAPDAVRSQIFSSHPKKNKVIFDLMEQANDLRNRLAGDEKVPRDQRYPYDAIPSHAFPKDATSKKKRRASAMEDDDPELSDAQKGSGSAQPAAEAPTLEWLQYFLGGDDAASGVRPKKKIRFPIGSDEEVSSGDEWVDTDEDIRSERGEQARAEMEWETTDGELTPSEDGEDRREQLSANEEDLTQELSEDEQQSRQRRPISVGVPAPRGNDSDESYSDSDSDSDVPPSRPVATPLRKTTKGKHRRQAPASPATPPKNKRKRTPQADSDDGSEGDDEAEMGSPQGRAIKKPRARGAK